MTRLATIIVLLLVAPILAQDAPDASEAKFIEQSGKVNRGVADAHVGLARWCFKQGLNVAGREQIDCALQLVPEHEKAMKELGYKRKKADGVETWVLDEKRAPPREDATPLKPGAIDAFADERDKMYGEAAAEYVKLGEYAAKLELPAYARVSYETAVRYDPLNEKALAGAGWVKDELDEWISPREARERDETSDALTSTPDPESVSDLPGWTSGAFKSAPAKGTAFGKITIIGSGDNHSEFGRFAWGASKLTAGLLGGEVDTLRVVVAGNEAEHQDYCATRHPGVPGLSQSKWVVGANEVEVVLDPKDDKLGLERAVYAVTVFEIRRRCGESRHPWFEIGFASNMTRRLLGRVTTAPFSGDASGPSESGRWKRTLRMLISDGRAPSLPKAVVSRDPDEQQVILVHYFVRYLVQERAGALPTFCAAWKVEDDAENALKQGWEADSATLEAAFLVWFDAN
ncbi:MAG: hypothetical protein K8I27_16645 [Planctomycetes bacterium]|nr:hypothetical protein [Planctomycetota bacterium]